MYSTQQTVQRKHDLLYWAPRILAIIVILFYSVLSLDVFGEYSGIELVVALLIHLIPSFVLTIGLIIGWINELYGAMVFNLLAIMALFAFNITDILGVLILVLPVLIIGELFFLTWYRSQSQFKD